MITGSSVRLGRSMALALAEMGADLCIHYRSSEKEAENLADEIRNMGRKACTIQADLSDSVSSSKKLIEGALEKLGRVDILINNASVFEPDEFGTVTEDKWDQHFSVNLKSPFFLSQEWVRQQPELKKGHLINIADWRGTRPGKDYLVYTMTKAALITMTKSLALALAPDIQVNAIAPGAILPPPGKSQEYLDEVAKNIPLKRSGSCEEIVHAVRYLLQSRFVTGEVVHVTGGQHM